MPLLEDVKLYLRIDGNMEDTLIESLIAAAQEDIKTASGKTKTAAGQPIEKSPLYQTAVKMLVAHWYDNRGVEVIGKSTVPLSNSYNAILAKITTSEEYV